MWWLNETPIERIDRWSIPEPNSGCWLWTGALNRWGYGRVMWRAKMTTAHRLSWRAYYGEIPAGLCVLHRCDVPCCVNPDHLWLGTVKDNTQDMWRKGRHAILRVCGSKNPRSKLTEESVRFILESPLKGTEVAKMFGVDKVTIYGIRRGRHWKHVGRK